MSSHQQAVCRSCGVAILWIETPNGKRTPVEATPVRGWQTYGDGHWRLAELHVSHFATCPDARRWRR